MNEAATNLSRRRLTAQAGDRFGRWIVLREGRPTINNRGAPVRWALCRCDCGVERSVRVSILNNGMSRSCGCLAREVTGNRRRSHGATVGGKVAPEHKIWTAMRYRCNSPSETSYPNYGGRGIRVCERWERSFEAFLQDMGPRPSPKHSIERINNGGHYEPGNCRWATPMQQGNNKRNNRIITIGDRSQTMAQWAREIGVTPQFISGRIRKGWTEQDAVTVPKGVERELERREKGNG